MYRLLFLIVFAGVMATAIELIHMSVYGRRVKESDLDSYLGKHLQSARLNPFSRDGSMFSNMPKYVSRSQSILSKWYIEDAGTVPRWSKWSKKLDEKRAELMGKKPSLADL